MTGIEHSILATATIAFFYYFGRRQGKKEKVEDIIEHTLNTLEKGNFVRVKTCEKTGEKELIPLDKYEKVW
jgi:Na+-transporting NADH:ubiquinone oxidoreductase subunit NqrA